MAARFASWLLGLLVGLLVARFACWLLGLLLGLLVGLLVGWLVVSSGGDGVHLAGRQNPVTDLLHLRPLCVDFTMCDAGVVPASVSPNNSIIIIIIIIIIIRRRRRRRRRI